MAKDTSPATATPCTAVARPDGFAQVPTRVLLEASPRALQVYALIARHANADGLAWPSQRHLAGEARCSLATVERAVAELVALEVLVVVEQRPTRTGFVNVYALEGSRTDEGRPVDNGRGSLTDDGRGPLTDEGLNETHRNEKPPAPVRACASPPTSPSMDRGSSVDELLQKIPHRVARHVDRRQRQRIAELLERTDRTPAWIARRINTGPDVGAGRTPGGLLVHRIGVLVDEHQEVAA